MSFKSKGEQSTRSFISKKWTFLLCLGCFCVGMLFTNRMGTVPESKGIMRTTAVEAEKLKLISEGCNLKAKEEKHVSKDIIGEVFKTHHALQKLDKTISNLEMELAAARTAQEFLLSGSPLSTDVSRAESSRKRKYLMVIGINTAFSSRKRRDSVRATWIPQGEKRKKLEDEKGIIVRFVIGHRGVRYHEPEHWKFGEAGNKYFRHATGQLYAISKDLATYISINQHVLHKYSNEDVSLGSWFIGLDVEHIDDRRLCCGTPPDCEWKAQAGNICVASFDWSCSGICKSAERIKEVHRRCGEGENALWSATF
ncbi:hypothetical protein CRYUN_Cryun04dG0187800 [Craigia yunnanensis]